MKRIVQSKSGKQNQTTQLLIEAALQLIRNRLRQEQRTFVELFAGTGNLTMAILEHCIHFDQLELQEIDQRRLNSLHIRFSAYRTVSIKKRDSYRIKTRWEPNTVYFAAGQRARVSYILEKEEFLAVCLNQVLLLTAIVGFHDCNRSSVPSPM